MTIHTIEEYSLYYYAKRGSESKPIAHISFNNDQHQFIGRIYFYKEGQPVPDNSENTGVSPNQVFLHASENQLPRIVDMLRNEKPCGVYYSSPTYASVFTGSELVGEEETEE